MRKMTSHTGDVKCKSAQSLSQLLRGPFERWEGKSEVHVHVQRSSCTPFVVYWGS